MRSLTIVSCAMVAFLLMPADGHAQYRRSGGRVASGGARSGLPPELARAAVADFSGVLRNFDKKRILLETADGQTLVFQRLRSTSFLPAKGHAALENGWNVQVEARKNTVGDLEALRVCEDACPKPAASPETAQPAPGQKTSQNPNPNQ